MTNELNFLQAMESMAASLRGIEAIMRNFDSREMKQVLEMELDKGVSKRENEEWKAAEKKRETIRRILEEML